MAHIPGAIAGQMSHVPAAVNLGMWDMFVGAEPIIKLVIMGLIVASIWSWTIILNKVYRLRRMNSAADQFEDAFWSGGALDDLYDWIHKNPKDPCRNKQPFDLF